MLTGYHVYVFLLRSHLVGFAHLDELLGLRAQLPLLGDGHRS